MLGSMLGSSWGPRLNKHSCLQDLSEIDFGLLGSTPCTLTSPLKPLPYFGRVLWSQMRAKLSNLLRHAVSNA